MAAKKKSAKSHPRMEAVRDPFEDALRARDVILERIESQMRIVLEAVTGMREELDSKLTALEVRLSERIRVLEAVVRQNSEDIKRNSEDTRKLQEEVAQLRRDFDRREEFARVKALEARIERVEAKLGIAS